MNQNSQSNKVYNPSWDEIKYRSVSNLYGETFWVTTYTRGSIFCIDVCNINYEYISEEEHNERQRKDERLNKEQMDKYRLCKKIVFEICWVVLTIKQKKVLKAYCENKTWQEIGQELGCSASAAWEVMHGNSRGQGGIIRRLKRLVSRKLPDIPPVNENGSV